tara:strand:+ start:193 stop:342 length:150 start_codon:yes stop_codon:yes gene_type:complete
MNKYKPDLYKEVVKNTRLLTELSITPPLTNKKLPNLKAVRNNYNLHSWG